MESGKNIINNSAINTEGGDFINGDNNFIQKVIINLENKEARLKSIIEQTKNVLNKIQSNISGVQLKRDLVDLSISELINENQFIFIDGEAGSGKSAYAKQILESLDNTCVISFAADQFLKSSLINTLHEINVDLSIEEVFNEFKEFSNRLVYIDSFEKLQEGDAEAFKELLAILRKNKDIKLITTCRSYALETLKFNYFDKQLLQKNSTNINVPQLTDEELDYFVNQIPALKSIVHNENLAEIINIPKYLSLADKLISVTNEDLSIIDVIEFKRQLWKNVVGGNNAIYEEKRQNTFIDIAVKRAKNLTLLTATKEFDSLTVYKLKADGVLFEKNNLYAPSHDIFEDWGLVRYVNNLKIENPKINTFYTSLSTEPAIRRGFRLWVESKIEESEGWIYNFVLETINSTSIENHWKDEILIAIIKSDLCNKFFIENKDELLEDDLNLLKKVIHLLKISGKNFNQSPNNKGWDVVIKFLFENIDEVSEIDVQILRFLYDWENILYFGTITNLDTPKYVGKIIDKILNNFEEGADWMNAGEGNSLTEKGIKLLYKLAKYIPDEIKILLDNLSIKAEEENYKIRDKKEKQMKYALSHFHSGTLPEFFPNELIELANLKWKYKKVISNSRFGFAHYETGIEHHFGLTTKHDFSYFPQSTYQTFIYKLLKSHPWKALDFIIEFTNYSVEYYVKSDFLKEDGFARTADDITPIEIFYNKKSYIIYGSTYLWSVNRGGQTTVPYLLQSIVVALERYLYEIGKIEAEKVDEIIQSFFDKIYTKSNSVILISVVSSIIMAYPTKVGDKILPLISDKNIFDWDRSRWSNDYLEKSLFELPNYSWEADLCDDERKEALKWEHRQKYNKGLTGFLIHYQLFYGNLEGKIFEMIDALENKHDKGDVYFLKLLSEIDRRKQKVEEVEYEGKKSIQISPNYSVDVSLEREMKRNEKLSIIQNEYSKYTLWIAQTFQKKSEESISYEYWLESLEYFKKTGTPDFHNLSPFPIGTLATLGLDLFRSKLSTDEFEFCINTILKIAKELYERKTSERDYESLYSSISIYDNDSVYHSLPTLLLFKNKFDEERIDEIRNLIFLFLRDIHPEKDIHLKHLYNSFNKVVWDVDYQFAYNSFIGLILYSEFNKKYKKHIQYSKKDVKKIQSEEKRILDFIQKNEAEYNFADLSYNKYSHWDLE
ncbi:MAG: ATP-binding protein, partial [Chitinophagales bacterium]|nr:ATP-binding protein [Chitinophagales bacterium]